MTSTLQDFGHTTELHGQIPMYYVFNHTFWLTDNQGDGEISDWLKANAKGFYKTRTYEHKSSRLNNVVRYVDTVYLQDPEDAMLFKLSFEVQEHRIARQRRKRTRTKRK